MQVSRRSQAENDHHAFSKKRMYLRPMPAIPINYASAAVPTFAPYGTEYTPEHSMKIIGGRRISIPETITYIPKIYPQSSSQLSMASRKTDPDTHPTKPIQNVQAIDNPLFKGQSKARFDTTYRAEYINKLRHPDLFSKPTRHFKHALNQYSVLPPIAPTTTGRAEASSRGSKTNPQQQNQIPSDQEVPSDEMMANEMPPLNFNYGADNYEQQQQQQPMMNPEDIYLPEDPVLLTDFEEQRLAEHVRSQLGGPASVDRLKVFYQDIAAFDPNLTGYVHNSHIQNVAYRLGLNLADDTLRFAMCKFVSPDRPRGFVNYEDLIRYFGKCLSSIMPNQYGNQQPRNVSPQRNDINAGYGHPPSPQKQPIPSKTDRNSANLMDDDNSQFDPDERQIRALLKQNVRQFEYTGGIDFDKLYRELSAGDRNQSGVLNRQQIEEIVYKVRIPLQRSLIYQILEKHCKAYSGLYRWQNFVRYLQEQILDIRQVQDRSSPVYQATAPDRNQWLDSLRKEFHENNRKRIIERYVNNNDGLRLENNHPTAWFTRFLRFTNALYTHRTNSNTSQDFVLPREEARRLMRAYNHVWDLKIDDAHLQRALDTCARNGHAVIDDVLKILAK